MNGSEVTTRTTVAVISGGVGAARLLRGIVRVVDPSEVTAIVNTGDDTELHGLPISPDLDTITYTLAGAIDPERGWGLAGETWNAMEALERYAAVRPPGSRRGATWFNLGDRDLATHLYRTARLGEGATLTEVTAEIARAWGLAVSLLPMTDDRLRTMVTRRRTRRDRFPGLLRAAAPRCRRRGDVRFDHDGGGAVSVRRAPRSRRPTSS